MTLKEKTKLLRGRRIVKIKWNSFYTGRGNKQSTDPVFLLDDGTKVTFSVEETEGGEYGISVNVHIAHKTTCDVRDPATQLLGCNCRSVNVV